MEEYINGGDGGNGDSNLPVSNEYIIRSLDRINDKLDIAAGDRRTLEVKITEVCTKVDNHIKQGGIDTGGGRYRMRTAIQWIGIGLAIVGAVVAIVVAL